MKNINDIVKIIIDNFIENRSRYRYVLTIMTVALIFTFSVFIIGDNLLRYIDLSSLLVVGVLPFFIMCVMFGFSNTKKIFNVPFIKNQTDKILNEALIFFRMFNRIIWMAALLVVIINVIKILLILSGHLSQAMDFRMMLAIALLSPLYAVLINLAIIIPYNIMIKRQINNIEECGEQAKDDLWKKWKSIKWYHFVLTIITIIIYLITVITTINSVCP